MNKNKYSYPLPYDIQEVLCNITTGKFLRNFGQTRGIFIPNGSKKTMGESLSLFFWDDDDITEIQNEAYQKKHTNALSGFVIHPKYSVDMAEALISIINKGDNIKGYKIDTPIIIENGDSDNCTYLSRLEYTRKKVAKLQFLQDEEVEFDFYIKKGENGEWKIEIDSTSSKDLSIIRDIYKKNLEVDNDIYEIEISNLSTQNTILFLDELRKKGLSSDWEFRDIKQLTLKRAKPSTSTMDNEDSDGTVEATDQELSGITQAILDGHHLREDPFVKKSENEGYIFTSMTYLFYHKTEPYAIQVKAEFKGKPKVFEISIIKSYVIEGVEQILVDYSLPSEWNLALRTEFWNNAYRIFKKMKI